MLHPLIDSSGPCTENYADAVAMAIELRRPYIFTCHARLAAWAIPVLQDGEPLPVAIICGGVLLSKPDTALIGHVEHVAEENGVNVANLVRLLDAIPVVPRKRLRAIADFLFQFVAAFVTYAALPGAAEVVPPAPPQMPEAPIVFPPLRRQETRKAALRRKKLLEQQSTENEIVRLIRDRKADAALDMLTVLLAHRPGATTREGVVSNLSVAETFTRLFRTLMSGVRTPRSLYQKQSRLISDALALKASSQPADAVEQLCRTFILIAEELTGEPRPRKLRTIQKHVEKNLSRKLTLGNVGARFGLSEKALDALIRKYCGTGFTDYVTAVRGAEARRLLLATDLGIGEIARKTGFKDQSYFSKVFKAQLGSTPTEFRLENEARSKAALRKDRGNKTGDTP
jgi:two-component system response regulator YesN